MRESKKNRKMNFSYPLSGINILRIPENVLIQKNLMILEKLGSKKSQLKLKTITNNNKIMTNFKSIQKKNETILNSSKLSETINPLPKEIKKLQKPLIVLEPIFQTNFNLEKQTKKQSALFQFSSSLSKIEEKTQITSKRFLDLTTNQLFESTHFPTSNEIMNKFYSKEIFKPFLKDWNTLFLTEEINKTKDNITDHSLQKEEQFRTLRFSINLNNQTYLVILNIRGLKSF